MVSMRFVEDDHRCIRSIVKDLATDTPLHYPSMDLLKLLRTAMRPQQHFQTLGFTMSTFVDPIGKSGGIWIVWDASHVNVRASLVSFQAIHATVHKEDYEEWVLATVYASPNPSLRDTLRNDLESVAHNMKKPWLVTGDFNDYDPQSAYVHKAIWDSNAVQIFLQLVVKELEASYKGSFHIMTMHGYRAVSKAFQECSNRFHEIDKNALKFKTKPLEHVKLIRRVYEGNMADQAGPSNIYENAGL
ncbi:hypothetical protein LOK49_LG01G03922 [Camellia lanceoleosa]|uniref:Uncharacterized protein n=1 Tax=Camellia lanceoleosa TaxID=1840588 RepID=A0ACC0IWS5_9ERIC|nr:hypothetical protein LOK49_LG01G03922 [Camellia lanceoleosa]